MKVERLSDFHRGWIIGDFHPSMLRTPDFEVGVMQHHKGEVWPAHTHHVLWEYNVLVKGSMTMQNQLLTAGDVFTLQPGDVADPTFHEDCMIVCVKVPSIPGDKHLV
jgi:quercetin dioxygenase-like cupin family protein